MKWLFVLVKQERLQRLNGSQKVKASTRYKKSKKEGRGTDIILHLREEESEYADEWRLRSIVTKYSDHISTPVQMYKAEVPESEGEDGEKIPAVPGEWESINRATALWTRDKSEISEDEYKEFYKHVSHDWEDPLSWGHNKVEGKTEYTSLLYIPKKHPLIYGTVSAKVV